MTPEDAGLSVEEIRGVADPGTADRGTDAGSRLTSADGGAAVLQTVPPTLTSSDRDVVDEALLRGASVAEIMGILSARALADTTAPLPRDLSATPFASPATTRPRRGFTLEDVYFATDRDLTDVQQRRLDQTEDKRPLVTARHVAYVEFVRKEFNALSAFVRAQFTPIVVPPYVDPYATAEEKYRGLRGAYYRAGWAFIKRDVFDHIVPASLFGSPIPTGVHKELAAVLKGVEPEVKRRKADLVPWLQAGKFVIGGFVPRFQAGSDQLSNHAYGLAIDIDATWNPQVKQGSRQKDDAMAAFQRATGERLDVDFSNKSSGQVKKVYDRMLIISKKLMAWLDRHLQRYDQLQEEIRKADKDRSRK